MHGTTKMSKQHHFISSVTQTTKMDHPSHQQLQCIHLIKCTEVLERHGIFTHPSHHPSLHWFQLRWHRGGLFHNFSLATTHNCLSPLPNCVVITTVVVATKVDPGPFSKFPNFHHFSVLKQLVQIPPFLVKYFT